MARGSNSDRERAIASTIKRFGRLGKNAIEKRSGITKIDKNLASLERKGVIENKTPNSPSASYEVIK